MRDVTFADIDRLDAQARRAVPVMMDEEAFGAFYGRTSRALWAYLSRVTGDRQLADDLLQETYYRFLRAGGSHDSEQHRRNYLFQIAANLVRDGHRRRACRPLTVSASERGLEECADLQAQARTERRTDVTRALGRLRPRDRALLWLAYAQGSSHREIAAALGLRSGSIKPMLARARHRLAALLGVDRAFDREGGSRG